MIVTSRYEVALDHAATFIDASPERQLVVAGSKTGRISIIHRDTPVRIVDLKDQISSMSLDPRADMIAWTSGPEGSLHIMSFDGGKIASVPVQSVSRSLHAGSACAFEADGHHLWHAFTLSGHEFGVARVATSDWQVVEQTILPDPFGESAVALGRAPAPNNAWLWLAAGQDGQQIYWTCVRKGEIVITGDLKLRDACPPVFSPNGKEFLCNAVEWSISRFTYPASELIGECHLADDEVWFEPFLVGGQIYLNGRFAVAALAEGRLFTVDLRILENGPTSQQKIAGWLNRRRKLSPHAALREEVVIQGHEPKPISVLYPTLDDDGSLCSDLTAIARFGDMIVTTHKRLPLDDGDAEIVAIHPVWQPPEDRRSHV